MTSFRSQSARVCRQPGLPRRLDHSDTAAIITISDHRRRRHRHCRPRTCVHLLSRSL